MALALGPTRKQEWLLATFGDKALHAAAFAIGCYLWGKSLAALPGFRRSAPLAAAGVALAVGLLIEWLQSFTPTRSTEMADILADVAGILPAVLLLYWQGRESSIAPESPPPPL